MIAFPLTAFLQQVKEDELRMKGGEGAGGRGEGDKLCRLLVTAFFILYYYV